MKRGDSTLVSTAQPTFEQGDYEMNMVELLPSRVSTRADNVWVMLESSRFERVVDIQTVGHNGGPQFDIVPNERLDGVLANRLHASETNSAKLSLCIPFYRNKNQGLALRSAPACSFLLPADVSFVNFHPPSQMFPSAANHNAPKFLKPTPGCLVTPKTVGVAQILGAQPRLLRHHQPHYMKPQPQRLATILEHRSSRHRTLAPTFLAMPQTAFGAPRPLAPAFWTDEPDGHRIHSRYAAHSSSTENHSRNSSKVRGYGFSSVALIGKTLPIAAT